MTYRTRIPIAATLAALVLAVAVGSASARRLEVSEQHIRIVWTFLHFASSEETFRIECPVTMEGSFHSKTISKVSGQLIGYLTRAAIAPLTACRNNEGVEAISLQGNTLPWHIRFQDFSGVLPNIGTINAQFVGLGVLIRALGLNCLYKSTAESPVVGKLIRDNFGRIVDLDPQPTALIPRFEGALLCPANGKIAEAFELTAPVTNQGGLDKITIALVQ